MATGGEDGKQGDSIMTRSVTGRGKPVDYKQLAEGNYGGATWDGREFDTDRSGESDTGLYHDVMKTGADPFMGSGIPRSRGDLDFQLAAENEELERLKRQLEGARKEEELLKKRTEADELRRKIAAQHTVNGRLRGMPNSDPIQIESRDKNEKSSVKTEALNDSDVDIMTLRKSKKLRKVVKKELKKLGLADQVSSDNSVVSENKSKVKSSSASVEVLKTGSKKNSQKSSTESELSVSYESSDSSSDSASKKKKKNKKKKKSGIRAKASDTVHFPQKYPQAYLKYEFTSSNVSFDKLDMNLFVAGELEIIGSSKTKEVERSGRISLLKKIMYLSTSYEFKTLKSYYAACLNEIEIGLKTWKDDFQQIESAILSKHVPKPSSQYSKKFPTKTKEDSDKKASGEKLWFCALYNRNKCQHKTSHTERRSGKFHFAHHICATCWQKDEKKLEHPECSAACPYAKV